MDYLTTISIVELTTGDPPRLSPHPKRVAEGGLRLQGKVKRSQPDKPLISVVTVVYNGVEYLQETILSVLNQTYDNVEYIIIDGGSTDGTHDIIGKYDYAIDYWVSEPDEGIADAFNKGITLCTGGWIGLLNADDQYEKETLQLVAQHNSSSIICGRLKLLSDEGAFELPARPEYLPKMMSVNHPTVFVKREYYHEFGLFDTNFKIAMDYELMLRFYSNHLPFTVLDNCLANMRMGGVSDTGFRRSLIELYHAKIKNKQPRLTSLLTLLGQYSRAVIIELAIFLKLGLLVKLYRTHCITIKREY